MNCSPRLMVRALFMFAALGVPMSAVSAPLVDQDARQDGAETPLSTGIQPLTPLAQAESGTNSAESDVGQAGPQQLEKLPEYLAAKDALREGNVDLCENTLLELYARQSNLSPPRLMMARMLMELGQLRKCQLLLEEIAGSHLGNPELYLLFGAAALADGRATDAGVHFEKARRVQVPGNWTAEQRNRFDMECLKGESVVAERHRDWGKLVQLYQRRVEAVPDDGLLRARWAVALYHDGQLQNAFEQFDIAYRQAPSIAPPEVSMAMLYADDGKFYQANKSFKQALANHADVPVVYFAHSRALMYQDRADEAERAAAKAAQLGFDSPALWMQRGDIAAQQNKFERAEGFYRLAFERNPRDLGATISLAIALVGQKNSKKIEEAVKLMEAAAQQHPGSPVVKSALGWVRFQNKELEAAALLLEDAAQQLRDEPMTLFFLGVVLAAQDRQADCLRAAKRLDLVIDRPGRFIFRPIARRWLATLLIQDENK